MLLSHPFNPSHVIFSPVKIVDVLLKQNLWKVYVDKDSNIHKNKAQKIIFKLRKFGDIPSKKMIFRII